MRARLGGNKQRGGIKTTMNKRKTHTGKKDKSRKDPRDERDVEVGCFALDLNGKEGWCTLSDSGTGLGLDWVVQNEKKIR